MKDPLGYPSVTEVVNVWENFDKIPRDVLERAALRGSEVHSWIQIKLISKFAPYGMLGPMKEQLIPYCESFKKWSYMALEKVVAVEIGVFCNCWRFYGHIDAIVLIKGDKLWSVIDWKTPVSEYDSWKTQLSAYKHLAEVHVCECGHTDTKHGFQGKPGCIDCDCGKFRPLRVRRMGAIMLDPKGKPAKMKEYTGENQNAWAAFQNTLHAGRYHKKWR